MKLPERLEFGRVEHDKQRRKRIIHTSLDGVILQDDGTGKRFEILVHGKSWGFATLEHSKANIGRAFDALVNHTCDFSDCMDCPNKDKCGVAYWWWGMNTMCKHDCDNCAKKARCKEKSRYEEWESQWIHFSEEEISIFKEMGIL